jgi:uncharacterized SAM-binding protein YcdF (DUF218 family)
LVRTLRLALVVYAVLLLVAVYTPATEWLAQPLYVRASPPSTADVIVILEAWAFENGELNESGVRRALRGAELYRDGVARVVLLSGSKPTPSRADSALIPMSRVLTLGGVPPESLQIEDSSANTHESAVHVAALARQHGWHRIVLVTDASHMRRAALTFQREGLTVLYAPTLVWEIGGAQPSLRFKRVGTLLHEYGGLAYYWWFGWL